MAQSVPGASDTDLAPRVGGTSINPMAARRMVPVPPKDPGLRDSLPDDLTKEGTPGYYDTAVVSSVGLLHLSSHLTSWNHALVRMHAPAKCLRKTPQVGQRFVACLCRMRTQFKSQANVPLRERTQFRVPLCHRRPQKEISLAPVGDAVGLAGCSVISELGISVIVPSVRLATSVIAYGEGSPFGTEQDKRRSDPKKQDQAHTGFGLRSGSCCSSIRERDLRPRSIAGA